MQSNATTVKDYLAELPDDRRQALTKLRALIRKAAPDAVEGMQWGMACYALGEPLVCLASQKQYIALYVDPKAVAAHRARLGKLSCGKSCIRIKKLADVPLDVLADILKDAVERRRAALNG
jgi:uncharacterized protein YdhG (YjbR/CyaY superfamily)